jgi:transcriptional regulator with XRE-family HTH domain
VHVMSGRQHPLRVAREARHWSIDDLAKQTGLSPRTLLRAEQGRGLNPASRRLICKVFGMSAEDLGLTFRRVGGKDRRVPSDRSDIDALNLRVYMRPQRVTVAHVQAARELTQIFRRQDNGLGGGYARAAAAEYLDDAVIPLLRYGRYDEDIGQALFGVAAELSHVVAWMAYDMQDHSGAKRYLRKALELASTSDDDAFRGEILAGMSHQAIHLGHAADTIELARASQRIAERIQQPGLLAEAHVMEAHGHALLGDSRLCVASLHMAELAFDRSRRSDLPEWLQYLDEGYLCCRYAHCFRDLRDWRQAAHFALRAVRMSDGLARAHAFNTVLLATTYVKDDIDQACRVGLEAVAMASQLQSDRILQYIRDLARRLRAESKGDLMVARFSEQVSEVLGARAWE